jgi:hypothetical protein
LYNIYQEYPRNLREFLRFFNELRDRKITRRTGFNKVLKIIDDNKRMEELANFKSDTASEIWNNDYSTEDNALA